MSVFFEVLNCCVGVASSSGVTWSVASFQAVKRFASTVPDLGAFQDLHLYLRAKMVADLPMLKFEPRVFRHIYLPPDIE